MEENIAEHFEKVAQSYWEFRNPEEKGQWGWMAGILDGEGSIGIIIARTKRGYFDSQLKVQVGMTHQKTIQRLKEISHVGFIRQVRKRKSHHKIQYRWICGGEKAAAVLRLCLPWLITKKDQALLALAFSDIQELEKKGRAGGRLVGGRRTGSKPLSAISISRRKALAEALHILNKRGTDGS